MKCSDIQDLGNRYLVLISNNKNDYPGQFLIGELFYNKVKSYMSLRPGEHASDRFFVHYSNGKCKAQNIGRHTIGGIPKLIAQFCQLKDAERYTGHCFRRTAATLLSESGASMQMIKLLGRWRSDLIAHGYIEDSVRNPQMIFDGITQHTAKAVYPLTPNVHPSMPVVHSSVPIADSSMPSTSRANLIASSNENLDPELSTSAEYMHLNNENTGLNQTDDFDIDWMDFAEEFSEKDLNASKFISIFYYKPISIYHYYI